MHEPLLRLIFADESRESFSRLTEKTFTQLGTLDGEKSCRELRKICDEMTQQARMAASAFSPDAWLWILRRSPDDILNPRSKQDSVILRRTAEALSGASSSITSRIPGETYGFVVRPDRYTEIIKFIVLARMVRRLMAKLRLAGKGVRFNFRSGRLPEGLPTASQREAICRYDSGFEMSFIARTGLALFFEVDRGPLLVCTRMPDAESRVSQEFKKFVEQNNEPGWRMLLEMPLQFRLAEMTPKGLGEYYKSFVLHDHRPKINALLWMLAVTRLKRNALMDRKLSCLGYEIFTETDVLQVDESHQDYLRSISQGMLGETEISDFETFIKILTELKPPNNELLVAPPVRVSGNSYLFDLCAATELLQFYLSTDNKTSAVDQNKRGELLESQVQEAIDESRWKPCDSIRALLGIIKREDGTPVSDIDAIGFLDGTLLIVDTKSRVKDVSRLLSGEYQHAKNRAVATEKEAAKVDALVKFMMQNRSTSQYDLDKLGVKKVTGVVCQSSRTYVEAGLIGISVSLANQKVCGKLYRVCSFLELIKFLSES